jgi:hypothetical protein
VINKLLRDNVWNVLPTILVSATEDKLATETLVSVLMKCVKMTLSAISNIQLPRTVLNVEQTIIARTTKFAMMMENVNVETSSVELELSVASKIKQESVSNAESAMINSVNPLKLVSLETFVDVKIPSVLNTPIVMNKLQMELALRPTSVLLAVIVLMETSV